MTDWQQQIEAQIADLRRYSYESDDPTDEIRQLVDSMHNAATQLERLQAWKDEHSRTEGGECPFCEIERLRHEIDVQCSSEYVERILKENERLRSKLKRIADSGIDVVSTAGKEIVRIAKEVDDG